MKNQTTKEYGTYTNAIYYPDGTASITHTVDTAASDTVSSGTIIHGNGVSPNPWSFVATKQRSLNGSLNFSIPAYSQTLSGVLHNSSGINQSNALSRAKVKAWDNFVNNLYSNLSSGTNLAVTLGESTNGRLKKSAARVVNAANDARRQAGSWGIRSIGKAWLGARYQWIPLLQDIYNVTQNVSNTMARKTFVLKAFGYASESPTKMVMSPRGITFSNVRCTGQIHARVKGVYQMRVNGYLDALARSTSLDPLVIAWELIPYSFVIDWFLNVGGYLESLEAQARYNSAVLGGYVTQSQLIGFGINHYGKSDNGLWTGHLMASYESKISSRGVVGAFPNPTAPKFSCDLGSGTLLNAAALLAAQLK